MKVSPAIDMKVSPANNHGVSKCFETEILSSKTGTEADIEWGYLVETHIETSNQCLCTEL